MELIFIEPWLRDDINWNFYFSGLLAYGFGVDHQTIDIEVERLRGVQHKTSTDYVRGGILLNYY